MKHHLSKLEENQKLLIFTVVFLLAIPEDSFCSKEQLVNTNKIVKEGPEATTLPHLIASPTGHFQCDINDYPYLVHIIQIGGEEDNPLHHHCQGILITYEWILTTGHCADPNLIGDHQMYVTAGSTFEPTNGIEEIKDTAHASNFQIRKVVQRIRPDHEPITGSLIKNDLGLILVDIPFDQSALVKPTRLPPTKYINQCNTVRAIGWQVPSHISPRSKRHSARVSEKQEPHLKCIDLQVVDEEVCKARLGPSVDDKHFCVYKKGNGVCQGHFGGPVICIGDNYDRNSPVVGLVSADGTACHQGTYAMLKIEPWIGGFIQKHIPEKSLSQINELYGGCGTRKIWFQLVFFALFLTFLF